MDAIVARIKRSEDTNPEYSLSELGQNFLIGETAAIISILGDHEEGTADTAMAEYLFGMFVEGPPCYS